MKVYDDLVGQISQLDLGLLVINPTSKKYFNSFMRAEPQVMESIIDSNVYQVAALLKKLLTVFETRKRNWGCIVVARDLSNDVAYGGTQEFIKYLVNGLQ